MAEIILDKINYTYSDGTAYEIQALKDVNLQIHQGEFIGIIGHTGSGKSTLTQLLNGLRGHHREASMWMGRTSMMKGMI